MGETGCNTGRRRACTWSGPLAARLTHTRSFPSASFACCSARASASVREGSSATSTDRCALGEWRRKREPVNSPLTMDWASFLIAATMTGYCTHSGSGCDIPSHWCDWKTTKWSEAESCSRVSLKINCPLLRSSSCGRSAPSSQNSSARIYVAGHANRRVVLMALCSC